MVGGEVTANTRKHTTGFATSGFNFWAFTSQAVHVGCRAAQIGNNACEAFDLVANVFDFSKHRRFTSALNDATFMLGDGAKGTPTKTAPHDVDGKANHFPSRNFGSAIVRPIFIGITGVWATGIRKIKNRIHFCCCQRNGRWCDPNVACCMVFTMGLHQTARIAWIGLKMQHTIGVGVQHRVTFNLFVTG